MGWRLQIAKDETLEAEVFHDSSVISKAHLKEQDERGRVYDWTGSVLSTPQWQCCKKDQCAIERDGQVEPAICNEQFIRDWEEDEGRNWQG